MQPASMISSFVLDVRILLLLHLARAVEEQPSESFMMLAL